MSRLIALFALSLGGCVSLPAPQSLLPITGKTQFEANLLHNYEQLHRLNESVGGKRMHFLVPEPPSATHIRRVIEPRLKSDVATNCPADEPVQATFLLIGETETGKPDVAYVVRVDQISGNGGYVARCGLVYQVDPMSGAVRHVINDDY